jgi:hypothetical protein
MDPKTRNLALLACLSLFLAGVAWVEDHAVFGSVFFALGAVAVLGSGPDMEPAKACANGSV